MKQLNNQLPFLICASTRGTWRVLDRAPAKVYLSKECHVYSSSIFKLALVAIPKLITTVNLPSTVAYTVTTVTFVIACEHKKYFRSSLLSTRVRSYIWHQFLITFGTLIKFATNSLLHVIWHQLLHLGPQQGFTFFPLFTDWTVFLCP